MERNSLTFLTIFILNSMIAKILKPSFNFQAVYYNEQKITEQKAELMAAVNFEGSLTAVNFLDKNDYINYFNEVSNLNPRVKRRQFHAKKSKPIWSSPK